MTVMGRIRTLFTRLAWLVLAALVAFGGAGIVAAMDHVPGTSSRAELTWAADRAAGPALDVSTDQLQRLSGEVDALGTTARLALAQVVAGRLDSLNGTISDGTLRLAAVEAEATALDASLLAVPGVGGRVELRLSADLRHRYDELARTRGLTDGLEADWAAFTGRALDAAGLTDLLARHDRETATAAREGGAAKYKDALKALDASDGTIAEARAVRDRLAPSTDVSTLTTWLDRNGAYDAALRTLYKALIDSKGRVTAAVRKAFDAEQAARKQLPADTRGLVVIMAEIAQGGLNQAVISIEEARGSLSAALELQRKLRQEPELPG